MADRQVTHVAWVQWVVMVVMVVLALAAVIAANLAIDRWVTPTWGGGAQVTQAAATYDDARYSLAGALTRGSLHRAQDETVRAERALYGLGHPGWSA